MSVPYTLGGKIKGSPVFSIKNVSILNAHNLGPERRKEFKKKHKLKCKVSSSWIFEPNFFRFLKFEVMLHNNQSGKFFYFIGWLSLIVFAQNFFLSTVLKLLESLSLKLRIHFLVQSVQFFWRNYFNLNKKTHFLFWRLISRTKQPRETKKRSELRM